MFCFFPPPRRIVIFLPHQPTPLKHNNSALTIFPPEMPPKASTQNKEVGPRRQGLFFRPWQTPRLGTPAACRRHVAPTAKCRHFRPTLPVVATQNQSQHSICVSGIACIHPFILKICELLLITDVANTLSKMKRSVGSRWWLVGPHGRYHHHTRLGDAK